MNADVQRVREWLRSQPWDLRMLTLIVLMTETVGEKYGNEARPVFDKELKEAYRNASGWNAKHAD